MECCLTWPEAFAITQTPSGLLWEPKLKTYVKLVLLTSQHYTVIAVMSLFWFHWIKKLKHMNNNVKTLNKWVYIFTLKLNSTKKKRKWDWEVRLVLSDYSLSFLTSGAEKWSQPRLSQTAVPLKSSKRWTVTMASPVLKSPAERFLSDGKGDQKWLNVMSSAWPETNLWVHKLNMRELIKVIEQRVALRQPGSPPGLLESWVHL